MKLFDFEGIYFIFNIGQVSLSVTATIFVLKCHFRGHKLKPVPVWIKYALLFSNKRLLINEPKEQTELRIACSYKKEDRKRNGYAGEIYDRSHASMPESRSSCSLYPVYLESSSFKKTLNHFDKRPKQPFTLNVAATSLDDYNLDKLLRSIKRLLKINEKSEKNHKFRDAIFEEWKEVARRLDLVMFVTTLLIVMAVPLFLFGKFAFRADSLTLVQANSTCNCAIR